MKFNNIIILVSVCLLFSPLFSIAQVPGDKEINISLVEPIFGISSIDTFFLMIKTTNRSDCKYSYNPASTYAQIQTPGSFFSTTNGFYHNITGFRLEIPDGETKTMYVLCRTDTGNTNDGYPGNITLGLDKTEPNINSAYANPEIALESIETLMTVTSDDPVICVFTKTLPLPEELAQLKASANSSSFKKTFTKKITAPEIQDEKNYTYVATCMNAAQNFAEPEPIYFSVNLSLPNKITKASPSGYINLGEADIIVNTNRNSVCRYGEGYLNEFPQRHTKEHFIQRASLAEGQHTYKYRCDFDQGSPLVIEGEILFTVDRTKPGDVEIRTESETCRNTSLSANLSVSDSDINGFFYRITDNSNISIINFTFTKDPKISLSGLKLERNNRYRWEAFATDLAGNNGSIKSSPGTGILPEEHSLCRQNDAPHINITAKMTEKGIYVSMRCTDPDGTCASQNFSVLNLSSSYSCNNCTYQRYNNEQLHIAEDATICYEISDNKHLEVRDSFKIKYLACQSDNSSGCCLGKRGQICAETCINISDVACNTEGLDTDGDGISDADEKACGLDPDNSSDAALDSDNDGLTNKQECLGYKGFKTDPFKADTDSDGFNDKEEIDAGKNPNNKNDFPVAPVDPNADTDNDGIKDSAEKQCGLDPKDPNDADEDSDDDGITNKEECLGTRGYKTDPFNADTDGDGFKDGIEIEKGTDPTDSEDFPKSNAMSILMFFFGFVCIVAGALLFSQDSHKSRSAGRAFSPSPITDFSQAKNDMKKEVFTAPAIEGPLHHPYKRQAEAGIPEGDLDNEIRKKRELLKMRKIGSVFDEFAQDGLSAKENKAYAKIEELREKNKEKVFTRLGDISNNDVYEELEIISKKEENKKKRMQPRDYERLDELERRGK